MSTTLREFKWPDEPKDVHRVQAMDGSDLTFKYDPGLYGGNWVDTDGNRWHWDELMNDFSGAVEMPKSLVEDAIEFFETRPAGQTYGRFLYTTASIHDGEKYTQALINHAKATV